MLVLVMRPIGLALLAIVLVGCARTNAVSTVATDGSWKRNLTFSLNDPQAGGEGAMKIEDVFALPTGPEWKVERATKDGETTVTATRDLKLGQSLSGDVTVLQNGKAVLVNEVTVRETEEAFEYREVYRWKGERPKELDQPLAELAALLDKVLPAEATAEEKVSVADGLKKLLWRALFGPGDPLALRILTQPDLAERLLRQRVGKGALDLLRDRLGEKMTEAQRRAAVVKLLESDNAKAIFDPKAKAEESQKSEKSNAFVTVSVSVVLPFEVRSANGESDPLRNEVFWAMLPEAAALEDVVLTASCAKK